ncbi:hypothetical protein ACFFIF_01870 [Vagococcus entomophilus]|uniref:Uncharacterized protein n=1 Tax=Vagococcus entomophilus TaxID=1160095 RepID=A0A430AK16_9ENTE|nr:hypothetical protein [Vagococcus entomophilus]RSU08451.1 hypothetical protein CBF30_04215 [Vagococcus entomophilus]
MKKADYTLVKVPKWIEFDCPYCLCENTLDYDKVARDYEFEFQFKFRLEIGNCKEKVTCENCGKEIELADVEIG